MMKMVKKTMQSVTACALSLALVAISVAPTSAQGATVRVPAGTSIALRTTSSISPATAKTGDVITLAVANDVLIGGKLVFKSGASARAEVTRSERRGIAGKPDHVTIVVQSVEAVDGSMIPVSATKAAEGEDKMVITIILTLVCLPLILMKGGEAQIAPGATLNAATNGVADIKASPLSTEGGLDIR